MPAPSSRCSVCCLPPAARERGRFGWANSRSLVTTGAIVLASEAVVARVAVVGVLDFATLGSAARWTPALAGAVGLGSFFGSFSSRRTCDWLTLTGLGTG